MTENEFIKLHQRAANGEKLTAAEFSVLQNWYDENDAAEDLLINENHKETNSAQIREQLKRILAQVAQSAKKAEYLARQNDSLQKENEILRRAVEQRLVEKAA